MLSSFGKPFADAKGANSKIEPITSADSFFGKPELNQSLTQNRAPTKASSGCLAVRIPDPPSYAPPTICAISKDGKIAAVGGRDVELFLWNTDNGELLTTIRGHDICWTTSNDNTFFVTVQEDSKVYIWDQQELKQRQLLGHPEEPLTCCSVSLDDMYVVVGGSKGGVYSWDSDSGVEYRQYDEGHTGPVQTVMCYPMEDGSHVIISCGAADHTIVVWDLETANKRATIVINELEHAKNLRYHISKDGTQVLVWCTDSVPFPNLIFVDALNNAKNSVYCHEGFVRHAVFAKDAAKIISCGSDGKIVMWDTVTLEPQITLTGHVDSVLCCGINDEGTRIVSSGEDCTIRIWSAEDGRQLQMMMAQDEPVKMCAFAKSGNKILTCDTTGRVYVWNTLSEIILNLIRRYADNISCVAMTNDHSLMAAGCNNGRIMMWDVDKRELLWEYSHHTGRVEAVAFNSLKDTVATAGADGRVSLIAVDSGKQVNCFLGQDEPITSISFSPDDERLAGCSADGKLLLYQVDSTGRKPKFVLRNNIARITSFVWSPNSKLIAGCGSDGCVLVWNATSGSIFTVLEGDSAATCCAFDFIGKLLAVGTLMGTTVLYNLETAEMLCELRNNASPIREVVFNQDTTRLTSVCSRQAIIWDVATTMKIRTYDFVVDKNNDFKAQPNPYRTTVAHNSTVLFDHESEGVVYDMMAAEDPLLRSYFLTDTRCIGTGHSHKTVTVWSAAGNTGPDKFHTTHDAITSCHFSHDDRLIVMGTQDGNVVVYDVLHNETVEVIAAHQNGPCRCVKLSHDNNEILSCGADAKVILWDWRKRAATRIYSGHFISIGCCDMAYQGTRVVSGDNHGMISVWEKETGNNVQTLPLAHSKALLSISMSADGSTIASVGADDKVSIWNVDLGIELVSLTAAIESHPLYCSFSPDGNKLAVTESNGNVMIWNAIAGCQWYIISEAHKGKVSSCSWSFDCRRLVTAGADSVMAVWDSESGAPLHKFNVKAGTLSCVSVSPQGIYVAAGSNSGTLSVINVPTASRHVPEPSFLYNWLATHEPKPSALLYMRLASQHPTIANVQDAQGWSLINHCMSKGNAAVANIVFNAIQDGTGSCGLISAVPFTIQTRVKFHSPGEGGDDDGPNSSGPSMVNASGRSMSMGVAGLRKKSVSRKKSFAGSKKLNGSVGAGQIEGSGDSGLRDVLVQKSVKSFSQQIKKVAVELFTEKRDMDHMELIMNNALALALNSKSSECVQVLLDAAADEKASWGSYHAVTDMMPSLAVRYPYMCYQFLASLQLQKLGDLEVPVAVMQGLDKSVIRTAPIFTNVKNLWQSFLQLHEVKHGPQPYAHVKASMVRLPFACSIGKESLLQTLVESNVPVQAYGTPTVRAVIKHKWRLYGRLRLSIRALIYCAYTVIFTTYAVLYSQEDHSLSREEYWDSSTKAKVHLIMDGYLFLQALWYAWVEINQIWAIGILLYLRSWWNTVDLVSITMMPVICCLHIARAAMNPGSALNPMVAIEVILVYFKIFFYALAFEPTGPVVHMVFSIAFAVKNWAVLLFLAMVAFGTSLMVLYQYVLYPPGAWYRQGAENYTNFAEMLWTMWKMVIGSYYQLDANMESGEWPEITLIIFSIFMFGVQIVMLNMLIALMSSIFNQVRNTEEDVFLRGRAQLIVEVETLMSNRQLESYALMPPYVHLLTPVQRQVHNGNSIEARLARVEAMLKEHVEAFLNYMRNQAMNPGLRVMQDMAPAAPAEGAIVPAADAHANQNALPPAPPGFMYVQGPNGTMIMVPMDPSVMGYGMMPGMMGMGMVTDPVTGALMSAQEQINMITLQAQKLRESESQLPAILRQIDRLQRTINNQEMRMEGMVTVLRDIENLLRNQQPVIIHQETRPPPPRRGAVLTEAELELEVKRLLGKQEEKL
mmetsp:Transcript_14469/g.31389  ORF Transcript_14469/g.31389 Transcript_14469/m.31389 type:complete len:1906 (-) Transcript_14469:1211-6928(-)